jgi:hypothetical protein
MSVVLSAIIITACAKTDSIKVEREVLVPGLKGSPTGFARAEGGGFLIIGASDTAWLVATDANGHVLWNHKEPFDPAVKSKTQSHFYGVVAAGNQRILVCGDVETQTNIEALVVILDMRGQVIERRVLVANEDRANFVSSFSSCLLWDDGIALIGGATNGKKGIAWLVKLDNKLSKQWESTGNELSGGSGRVMPDSNLVLASGFGGNELKIARIDKTGHVVASRSMPYPEGKPILSYPGSNQIQILATTISNQNVLLTLNGDLSDSVSTHSVGPPSIRDGCAYALTDGSIVLFGTQFVHGGVYRASIGRWQPHSFVNEVREMSVPEIGDASASFLGAIPISPNRFVAIRDQFYHSNPDTDGVLLSWVLFK